MNREAFHILLQKFRYPSTLFKSSRISLPVAVFSSMDGKYELAVISIIVAVFLDGLDGKVARAANAVSDFGKDYDSLCDLISFGVAPSILFYSWATNNFIDVINVRFLWLLSFFYIATTALRLARFNNHLVLKSENYFIGLPSPASAMLVTVMLWQCVIHSFNDFTALIIISLFFMTAAILMVSKVEYSSFKDLRTLNRMPFNGALLIPLIFILIIIDAPNVLSVLSIAYLISGLVAALIGVFRNSAKKKESNLSD